MFPNPIFIPVTQQHEPSSMNQYLSIRNFLASFFIFRLPYDVSNFSPRAQKNPVPTEATFSAKCALDDSSDPVQCNRPVDISKGSRFIVFPARWLYCRY